MASLLMCTREAYRSLLCTALLHRFAALLSSKLHLHEALLRLSDRTACRQCLLLFSQFQHASQPAIACLECRGIPDQLLAVNLRVERFWRSSLINAVLPVVLVFTLGMIVFFTGKTT